MGGWWFDLWPRETKDVKIIDSAAPLGAQHIRVRDRLSGIVVRIMVCVGTSLPTRGLVFQWASTIKTGRRSD